MENIKYVNPDDLIKNPAFSQVAVTIGHGKTIYVGGQNAVNKDGVIIGKGDIALQTEQVMKNLEIALHACNADFENLVKMNIYIVQGQDVLKGFQASQKFFKKGINPPVISAVFVAGLGNPDYLLEVDAVAFIPS